MRKYVCVHAGAYVIDHFSTRVDTLHKKCTKDPLIIRGYVSSVPFTLYFTQSLLLLWLSAAALTCLAQKQPPTQPSKQTKLSAIFSTRGEIKAIQTEVWNSRTMFFMKSRRSYFLVIMILVEMYDVTLQFLNSHDEVRGWLSMILTDDGIYGTCIPIFVRKNLSTRGKNIFAC